MGRLLATTESAADPSMSTKSILTAIAWRSENLLVAQIAEILGETDRTDGAKILSEFSSIPLDESRLTSSRDSIQASISPHLALVAREGRRERLSG